MNDVKNTTMIWKRMNYSAQKGRVKKTAGLSQLKSSLNHSLRTVMKKELEFNQDLSNRNYIIHKNKMVLLDSLTLQSREELVKEIMSSVESDIGSHQDLTKLKDDRAKYAYKLKKMLAKADEPDELKNLVSSVLGAKNNTLSPFLVDQLDAMSVKRVNDKKKAIGTFISLHNEIIEAGNNSLHKSKTVIQECFFKFPTRNNITEVKPVDYLRIIHDFHKKYLPDYEIKVCVFHGDEVLSQKEINNGVHPHIFISGKNSETGKYDLVNSQLALVNRYRNSKNEPELKNNSFQSAQKIGEAYQYLVYGYVNKRLKEFGYSIEASIHEKTEEHKAKLKKIKEDENKAKILRSFNLLSHTEDEIYKSKEIKQKLVTDVVEISQENIRILERNDTLKNENKNLLADKNSIRSSITSLTDKRVMLETAFTSEKTKKQAEINGLSAELKSNHLKVKAAIKEVEILESRKNRLVEAMKVIDKELTPLIHRFDVKLDKTLDAKRLDEPTKTHYKELKINMLETAMRLGKEKRKDYLESALHAIEENGLDTKQVKFGLIDKAVLFASDTFTNKKIIEYDKKEVITAKTAREQRKRNRIKPG